MVDRDEDVHEVQVFDLTMATAYYACVFDAEFTDEARVGQREMRIGEQIYRLVANRAATGAADPLPAPVEDVDVSIARVATKGGRIVKPATSGEGGRAGEVLDPFGHRWRVSAR